MDVGDLLLTLSLIDKRFDTEHKMRKDKESLKHINVNGCHSFIDIQKIHLGLLITLVFNEHNT